MNKHQFNANVAMSYDGFYQHGTFNRGADIRSTTIYLQLTSFHVFFINMCRM